MKFDLSKYATVAERLTQAHKDHPDLRIVTEVTNIDGDIGKTRWVVKATLFLSAGDQANGLAKATGYAFEVDGSGGANATSALENCESSAIGRCLMVAGYAMNKEPNALASREEMQKVERVTQTSLDYLAALDNADTVQQVRDLYAQAVRSKADKATLDKIKAKGEKLK
jgi:hypothetical protein